MLAILNPKYFKTDTLRELYSICSSIQNDISYGPDEIGYVDYHMFKERPAILSKYMLEIHIEGKRRGEERYFPLDRIQDHTSDAGSISVTRGLVDSYQNMIDLSSMRDMEAPSNNEEPMLNGAFKVV